jgi:hypothetical protein
MELAQLVTIESELRFQLYLDVIDIYIYRQLLIIGKSFIKSRPVLFRWMSVPSSMQLRHGNLKLACHHNNIKIFAVVKHMESLLYTSFGFDIRLRHCNGLLRR